MRAKEARTRAEAELVKVKILKAEAETEFLKVKAEKIRLENLQYAPSAGEPDRSAKLQERIDRLRAQTRELEHRYGLEPDDLDDEDDELDESAMRTPGKRLVRRRKR
jgi:hypothetical protein